MDDASQDREGDALEVDEKKTGDDWQTAMALETTRLGEDTAGDFPMRPLLFWLAVVWYSYFIIICEESYDVECEHEREVNVAVLKL